MLTTAKEQALSLAARGALIIPIPHGTKGPKLSDWPEKATSDPATIMSWFNEAPDSNYGVMGTATVGAICGFDVDSPSLIPLIEAETGRTFPQTLYVHTSKPSPAGHYYFLQTERSIKLGNCTSPKNFEWRANRQQVVGPGSIHPSGSEYTAEDIDAPILPIPDWLVDWMEAFRSSNRDTRGSAADLVMSTEAMEADCREKLDWLINKYLNPERKNKDNPNRPVVYSKIPLPYVTGSGLRGYKIYVKCPAKHEHSCDSGMTEAALLVIPGQGYSFTCRHASHESDAYDWHWYRRMTQQPDDLNDMPLLPEPEPEPDAQNSVKAKDVRALYGRNDDGNALRLFDRYGDSIRYMRKDYYIWNGERWQHDPQECLLTRLVTTTHRLIHTEVPLAHSDDEATALLKWDKASGNMTRISATAKLIGKMAGVSCMSNPFDADPWLLNVKNGTIDLITGEFRPFRREDYMSKMADVVYDPSAICPQWDAFLLQVMDDDFEMVNFLARYAGYLLTGDVAEETFLVCEGDGANGKTTFNEVIASILGEDYAHTADMSLMTKKRFGGNTIPTDVAAMAGKRMVILSESDQQERLDEGRLKKLISNAKTSARALYKDPFAFRNAHKLVLETNHQPLIIDTTNGIWRRLKRIKWSVSIPEAQQNKRIQKDLLAEASGILNWMLRGLADYHKQGLVCPQKVIDATNEWRMESDPFNRFVEESAERHESYKVQSAILYSAYKTWCKENSEYILNSQKFKLAMEAHGFRHSKINGRSTFNGLRLQGMSI